MNQVIFGWILLITTVIGYAVLEYFYWKTGEEKEDFSGWLLDSWYELGIAIALVILSLILILGIAEF